MFGCSGNHQDPKTQHKKIKDWEHNLKAHIQGLRDKVFIFGNVMQTEIEKSRALSHVGTCGRGAVSVSGGLHERNLRPAGGTITAEVEVCTKTSSLQSMQVHKKSTGGDDSGYRGFISGHAALFVQ